MHRQKSKSALSINIGQFTQQFFIKVQQFCIIEQLNVILSIVSTQHHDPDEEGKLLLVGYKMEEQSKTQGNCIVQLPIARIAHGGFHNSNMQCIQVKPSQAWLVMIQLYCTSQTNSNSITKMYYALLTCTQGKISAFTLDKPTILLCTLQIQQTFQSRNNKLSCLWYEYMHQPVLQFGHLSINVRALTHAGSKTQPIRQEWSQHGILLHKTIMISPQQCVQMKVQCIGIVPVYEHKNMALETCRQLSKYSEYDWLVTDRYITLSVRPDYTDQPVNAHEYIITYQYEQRQSCLELAIFETAHSRSSVFHTMNNINREQICIHVTSITHNDRAHLIQILNRKKLHVLYTYNTASLYTNMQNSMMLANSAYMLFGMNENKIVVINQDGSVYTQFYYMSSDYRSRVKLIGSHKVVVIINDEAHFITLDHNQSKQQQPEKELQQYDRIYMAM